MKIDDKNLEVIKVLSLVVIAISSAYTALWLNEIRQILSVIGNNLGGASQSLFDLLNKG